MQYLKSCQLVLTGLILLNSCLLTPVTFASSLEVNLKDKNAEAIADAVVLLYPNEGQVISNLFPNSAIMAQRNMEFVPHVLPVYRGTTVKFPNEDETRHHVYSFSQAKIFELRLYDGDTQQEVDFDEPGPIVLGCNIHDEMLGYIYVSDTPIFLKSNTEGLVSFVNLIEGQYRMRIWHPRMRDTLSETEQVITLEKDSTANISAEMHLRRARRSTNSY